MARGQRSELEIKSERLAAEILAAYPQGLFPMSQSRDDQDYAWFQPELRGVIPINGFHVSRSMLRYCKRHKDEIKVHHNTDFEQTMISCAAREETWISPIIIAAFSRLAKLGYAHALTVTLRNKTIGGIYGLAIGQVFFGESMYSAETNGSKMALWALTTALNEANFRLFDTQYLTEHLASLGAIEITNQEYQIQLQNAISNDQAHLELAHKLLSGTHGGSDNSVRDRRSAIISAISDPNIITWMIKRGERRR